VKAESAALISGLGSSDVGRRLHRDPLLLTADAALAAIADAGLERHDIDGLSTYPGAIGSTPGITGAGIDDVRTLLGLDLRWHTGGLELAGQLGSIANAVLAVAGGLATHILCFRSVWESTAQVEAGDRSSIVARSQRREVRSGQPYGVGYATYGALAMQRYMHESGATREQFAQARRRQSGERRPEPRRRVSRPPDGRRLPRARMISDPLCLFDCDVPVDGAVAFVVSRADSSAVHRRRALRIEALGTASGFQASADMLWSRTDLKPSDVDVAEIYDGFTIYSVRWLEALSLTPRNETGPFIEDGRRISLDGELPISTGGGQLSAGRLHGYGALLEACIQPAAGRRHPSGAGDRPRSRAVSSGAESFTSCLLLTR